MSVLEDSRESMPAADLQSERLLLSACLVANWQQRDPCTLWLTTTDFHDPFHAWLFTTMRHNRRCNTEQLLAAILQRHRDEPAQIGNRPMAYELARLIYSIDGVPISGDVKRIKKYVADVKHASEIRTKQIQLETQLIGLLQEAADYERSHANDF